MAGRGGHWGGHRESLLSGKHDCDSGPWAVRGWCVEGPEGSVENTLRSGRQDARGAAQGTCGGHPPGGGGARRAQGSAGQLPTDAGGRDGRASCRAVRGKISGDSGASDPQWEGRSCLSQTPRRLGDSGGGSEQRQQCSRRLAATQAEPSHRQRTTVTLGRNAVITGGT